MERKTNILLVTVVLSILSLAGVAVTKLISGSGPSDTTKQLTQEQRLNALENLTPRSSTVRAMVRGEKANEDARKEAESSGR